MPIRQPQLIALSYQGVPAPLSRLQSQQASSRRIKYCEQGPLFTVTVFVYTCNIIESAKISITACLLQFVRHPTLRLVTFTPYMAFHLKP